MTGTKRRARLSTARERRWRGIASSLWLVVLVPAVLVAYAIASVTLLAGTGMAWVAVPLAVVLCPLVAWLGSITVRRLPPLDPTPCRAIVTSVDEHGCTGEEGSRILVSVRAATRWGERAACIADIVDPRSLPRFTVGSVWLVHAFQDDDGRVLLAAAHDDVVREGYDLSGVRIGGEVEVSRPGTGSELLLMRARPLG